MGLNILVWRGSILRKWEPLFNKCARGVRAATVKTRPAEAESVTFDNDGGKEGEVLEGVNILVLYTCVYMYICIYMWVCDGNRLCRHLYKRKRFNTNVWMYEDKSLNDDILACKPVEIKLDPLMVINDHDSPIYLSESSCLIRYLISNYFNAGCATNFFYILKNQLSDWTFVSFWEEVNGGKKETNKKILAGIYDWALSNPVLGACAG